MYARRAGRRGDQRLEIAHLPDGVCRGIGGGSGRVYISTIGTQTVFYLGRLVAGVARQEGFVTVRTETTFAGGWRMGGI